MSFFILAFLTSLVTTLLVVRSASSHGWMTADTDFSGPQKFHTRAVPRIGGVGGLKSRHDAMLAAEAGADYVAFGACFPSTTKEVTTPADLEIVEWWSGLMELPCVAIGGITLERAPEVIAAGAASVAVISDLLATGDPAGRVREFLRALEP